MQRTAILLALLVLATACATTGPAGLPGGPQQAASGMATLTVGIKVEPASLASKSLGQSGATLGFTRRLFNADLTMKTSDGAIVPYLAETVPQLGTDTWQVFPDGRMETTYQLRPNLTWHDGNPLTASDFAFALQVYADPAFANASSAPISLLDGAAAPDERTVVLHWKRPFPYADILGSGGGTASTSFGPLPRHLLEAPLREGDPDSFMNHPYWTREFIGLGPYRLSQWEPGAFLEGTAFEGHTWGRPKIDRVKLTFIADPNTALANMLAGEIILSADDSIRYQEGATLRRQWGPTGGSVSISPSLWRQTSFQQRPELARPAEIRDPRVRKALAFAIDRESLNQALFDGEAILADSPIPPGTPYDADLARLERPIFDPRRSQALMAQAGLAPGADGMYVGSGGRLSFEITTTASTQNEIEESVLAAGWREVGFDFHEAVLPAALAQDGQARASFPGLYTFSTPSGEDGLAQQVASQIPRPENRWSGSNRGGWSNPEFDRLSDQLSGTLDRAQRNALIVRMATIHNDELPVISLYFNPIPIAHSSRLQGPTPYVSGATFSWDIVNWQVR